MPRRDASRQRPPWPSARSGRQIVRPGWVAGAEAATVPGERRLRPAAVRSTVRSKSRGSRQEEEGPTARPRAAEPRGVRRRDPRRRAAQVVLPGGLPDPDVVDAADPDGQQSRPRVYDRILVNKLIQTIREPKRWDITVFKYPLQKNQNYVKRIVGMPERPPVHRRRQRATRSRAKATTASLHDACASRTTCRRDMWKNVYPLTPADARAETKALGEVFSAPRRATGSHGDRHRLHPRGRRGAPARLYFRDDHRRRHGRPRLGRLPGGRRARDPQRHQAERVRGKPRADRRRSCPTCGCPSTVTVSTAASTEFWHSRSRCVRPEHDKLDLRVRRAPPAKARLRGARRRRTRCSASRPRNSR